MINTIIFSKDRAMQLDCLLRSMHEYTDGLFRKIVIYKYSDEEYHNGYKQIMKLHPNVDFVYEKNLKEDVLRHMATYYTMFCVDDMVMFKKCPEIMELGDMEAFSLRLGDNIGHPHTQYPLSVDGHIFITENIKPFVERIDFINPNKLEAKLQKFKDRFKLKWDYQCTVSIPHNKVSTTSRCYASGLYTEKILNDHLLNGYMIDYYKMDFKGIKNVHAEVDFKFKLRD